MSFRLLYTDKAADQLGRLPSDLLDGAEAGLLRLSTSPTSVSVPIASPPYPPRGQLYHFDTADAVGLRWFFTVIFRYSQDETALQVLSVTWRELGE